MRHRKTGLKLNRTSSHRNAMFRNMVTSLLKHEKIRTTDAKAKELRRWADHLITLAKQGDLHARRQAMSIVQEKQVVHRLFEEAPARYASVSGGYTRVIKLGTRPGDAAPISLVELITPDSVSKKSKKKPAKSKAAPKKPAAAPETKKAAETTGAAPAEEAPSAETPETETEIQATEQTTETEEEAAVEEKASEPEEEAAAGKAEAASAEQEADEPVSEPDKSKKKTAKKTGKKTEDES